MNRNPWWWTTTRRRHSLYLGIAWGVLAIAQWLFLDPQTAGWRWLLPVGQTVLAVGYLLSWTLRGRSDSTRQHHHGNG